MITIDDISVESQSMANPAHTQNWKVTPGGVLILAEPSLLLKWGYTIERLVVRQ